jgi:glyoxylate/hydroxypyruvate reductase A
MSFLIISTGRDPQVWIDALKQQEPDLEIEVYPEVKHPEKVEFVLTWNHPQGAFSQFPNLKVIASMGAGIDHIINDPDIPKEVEITRVIDEQLTKDMSVFVLSLCLEYLRNLSFHHCSKNWEPSPYKRPEDLQVGIMGLGVLGVAAAEKLIRNKFNVNGWRKTRKDILGVNTYYGEDQLEEFLKNSNILVCLLPLTSETENILNRDLFQKLPKDAYLINVARGNHLVEEDLLDMINSGHLSGASLDVFRQEPLPQEHPFWRNEKIRISPHIASVTNPDTVVPQLLENFHNMKNNSPLINLVSREKEY